MAEGYACLGRRAAAVTPLALGPLEALVNDMGPPTEALHPVLVIEPLRSIDSLSRRMYAIDQLCHRLVAESHTSSTQATYPPRERPKCGWNETHVSSCIPSGP